MLHITYDDQADERLRPIPFPRERAGRRRRGPQGAGREAERLLERAQSQLDELAHLMDGPLPFPGREEDDGPRAA